jgi:hypothetical protein
MEAVAEEQQQLTKQIFLYIFLKKSLPKRLFLLCAMHAIVL